MAEDYYIGTNKIVYKSLDFKEGLNVSVDLFHPDGSKESGIPLIEMEDGLYYFNYNFVNKGIYTGIFYENTAKIVAQNFRIEPEVGRRMINNNLINLG